MMLPPGEATFPACRVMMMMMMTALVIARQADCHTMEHLAVYKTSVYLRCHDAIDPSNWSYCYQWIVPSAEILSVAKPMTDSNKYSLTQNGSILHIHRVDYKDFGLYHCLVFLNVSTSEIVRVTQHGLNTNYQASQDQLLTKYTSNIQYGAMAGFVVLVVMAMMCYNYDQHQERFDITPPWCSEARDDRPRKDSMEGQELKPLPESKDVSYHNHGFGGEEEEEFSLDTGNKNGNSAKKQIQTKL